MTQILAALDSSLANRPVMETALRVGRQLHADVSALHVADRDDDSASWRAAGGAGVEIRVVDGAVPTALLRASAAPEVVAAVVGARAPGAHRFPFGHVVRELILHGEKPLVVVPPELVGDSRPIRRILFALEADDGPMAPAGLALLDQLGSDVEVLVGRVFTDTPTPMFVYHRIDDPRLLADELARHDGLTVRSNQVLRLGRAAEGIVDASLAEETDLVVLSGARRLSGAPSVIVKDVLEHSPVAIVLLGRGATASRSRITSVAL